MSAQSQGVRRPEEPGWTIAGAEELLQTLPGVISVRIVARPGGEIQEIHLLTSEKVRPKQTVRNVESALLAHFDLELDHRKISVAQSQDSDSGDTGERGPSSPAEEMPPKFRTQPDPPRIIFVSHKVDTERSHRVRASVTLEWGEHAATGEATGADLLRPRLEAVASATLRGVEELLALEIENAGENFGVGLDGVKMTDAFDRRFVLVSVHAIHHRDVVSLAGASAVEDTPERAVILATLQATDRWIRGRI